MNVKSSSHSWKTNAGVLVFFRKDLRIAELSLSLTVGGDGVEGDLLSSKLVAITSRTLTRISDFDLVSILPECLPLPSLLDGPGLLGSKVESPRCGAVLLFQFDKNLHGDTNGTHKCQQQEEDSSLDN